MIDLMRQEKIPKVSACIITYNQKNYIGQCLQSILDQETDFDFEVIVGDDCSTDGTREIVQEFADKYPTMIRTIFQERNTCGTKNYLGVHKAARGQYIAHIDGDDCALPGKLQKQADFLDHNMDCSVVVHPMLIAVNGRIVGSTRNNPTKFDIRYLLLKHPCFLSSSIMYRKICNSEFLSYKEAFIDFYVYIALAKKGFIGCINEALGNYRSGVGTSAGLKLMPLIQRSIDFAGEYLSDNGLIGKARARQYLSYAVASLIVGEKRNFFEFISSAKDCNNKNLLIGLMFYMKNYDRFIRFFVLLYKSSKLKIFNMKQNLFGRHE
jgi:glycosyltransferase involved in cell wall biosynthesis